MITESSSRNMLMSQLYEIQVRVIYRRDRNQHQRDKPIANQDWVSPLPKEAPDREPIELPKG